MKTNTKSNNLKFRVFTFALPSFSAGGLFVYYNISSLNLLRASMGEAHHLANAHTCQILIAPFYSLMHLTDPPLFLGLALKFKLKFRAR